MREIIVGQYRGEEPRTEPTDEQRRSPGWRFAQEILGRPIPSISTRAAEAQAKQRQLESLAQFSTRHRQELHELLRAEAEARAERARLEWLAKFSPEHDRQLRALQVTEAEDRRLNVEIERSNQLRHVAEWDPAEHPRLGGPPNAGWWVTTTGQGSGESGTRISGTGFQDPTAQKPSAGNKPANKSPIPRPAPKLDDPDRRWTLDAAMGKLKLPNVSDPVRQRIRQTLEAMYDLGEGSVSRELIKDLARQKLPIEVYNGKDPLTQPDYRYGFDPAKPAKMYLNLNPKSESFGAEVTMQKRPEEKPPSDWRGDVVVLAHELGHVLDDLKLTDAKFSNGKAPYYGPRNEDVRGANPILENAVRKDLDEHSKQHGDAEGVRPRPSYSGVKYDRETPIAGEEFDRMNRLLQRVKKEHPRSAFKVRDPREYRKNP